MQWLKDIIEQFKSKTVWGVILLVLNHYAQKWFSLSSEEVSKLIEIFAQVVQLIGVLLTTVGVNHKLEKWLQVIRKKGAS